MARASTTARGLGHTHRVRRAQLPPPNGQPCPYCARPMWPGMKLDADHMIPRALGGHNGPLRWAHRSCNRSEGQRLKTQLEKAKRRRVIRTDLTW